MNELIDLLSKELKEPRDQSNLPPGKSLQNEQRPWLTQLSYFCWLKPSYWELPI
jgi:hypothetical protein